MASARRSVPLELAILGLALVASACSPTGVRYTAVPTGEPAVTEPAVAAPAAPTGDRQLDVFLADLASALDREDWYSVARMIEGSVYADLHDEAVASGLSPEAASARLIADALGLGQLEVSGIEPFQGLGQIQVVTLRESETMVNGVIQIRGDVRLTDHRRLPLTAFAQRAPDTGRYRLILSRA